MPIFIDNRGSGEATLADLLKNKHHLEVVVKHLDSGDIVFGEVGIERKTLSDLINSIAGVNRHFWEQIKVLKDTYKNPFILIEGPINYRDKWISGVIWSILLGWKVPIIPTFNLEDSALAISSLFIKYGVAKSGSYPAVVRKADSLDKIRWAMLQCVRGIGPKAATEIMSVMNPFIEFKPNKLKGIRMPKRSKEILNILFNSNKTKVKEK